MTQTQQQTERLPTAVLISGGGTTLKNLLERIESEQLPIDVRLVVSSNPRAGGLQYAQEANIDTVVVERKSCPDASSFQQAIFDPCRSRGCQLVVMAGFLKHVLIPEDYENRVMNIHPGLIPAFCGHGFYGARVHQKVLEYGAKISGCTIHFVDDEYDHGPIILQRVVEVCDDDTPETLAARVFAAECEAYPQAIRLFAEGRIQMDGRRVRISEA